MNADVVQFAESALELFQTTTVFPLRVRIIKKALEEIMPRIRSLFALGQYEDALKEIESAEKIDPGNPSLKLYRDRKSVV